jgi:pSer/pThr/pTyr-binding forkhead associated (FHA) protein
MKLSLLVKRAQGGFQEIPIRLPQFLIGRDPDCHLRPVSPLVSKRHCAIIIREGKAFLKDFESTNGTLHNGRLLKGEIELADGDEFKVGPLVFKVKLVQESTGSSAKFPKVSESAPEKAAAKPAASKTLAQTGQASPGSQKPSASSGDLEDLIAQELLLNVDKTSGQPVPASERSSEDLGGSTILELPKSSDTSLQNPAAPEKKEESPPKKPQYDARATAEAAKAILDKYLRRPRTTG